jgi:hypothetical protein
MTTLDFSLLQSAMLSKSSVVHGLAPGQKPSQARPHRPSQAKPKVLAWVWLWLGLDFLEAKANGPGHGFEHNFFKQLLPMVIALAVAQQALK